MISPARTLMMEVFIDHPKQSNFIERLEDNLSNLRSDCETYILGDMNISYQQQCSLQESYKGLLRLFNLQQLINSPTRITPTSSTTIDHVLTNSKENIVQSGTIPCGLSDHLLIYCTRKTSRGVFNSHNTVRIRSMKKYVAENFIDQLRNADWSGCLNNLCVNSAWKSFQEVFMSVLDNIAPVKEVRIKQRTEEWMTSDILDLIHCRDKFLYNFKKYGNHDDYVNFNKLRNKVQREIKRAKSEFFSGKIEENKKNPKNVVAT